MSGTFSVNISAPGSVMGWIRRWIAGNEEGSLRAVGIGRGASAVGGSAVCRECLLMPLERRS